MKFLFKRPYRTYIDLKRSEMGKIYSVHQQPIAENMDQNIRYALVGQHTVHLTHPSVSSPCQKETIQTEQTSPAPSVSCSLHAPAVPGMLEGPSLTHSLSICQWTCFPLILSNSALNMLVLSAPRPSTAASSRRSYSKFQNVILPVA